MRAKTESGLEKIVSAENTIDFCIDVVEDVYYRVFKEDIPEEFKKVVQCILSRILQGDVLSMKDYIIQYRHNLHRKRRKNLDVCLISSMITLNILLFDKVPTLSEIANLLGCKEGSIRHSLKMCGLNYRTFLDIIRDSIVDSSPSLYTKIYDLIEDTKRKAAARVDRVSLEHAAHAVLYVIDRILKEDYIPSCREIERHINHSLRGIYRKFGFSRYDIINMAEKIANYIREHGVIDYIGMKAIKKKLVEEYGKRKGLECYVSTFDIVMYKLKEKGLATISPYIVSISTG